MINRDGEFGLKWFRELDSLQELFASECSAQNRTHSDSDLFRNAAGSSFTGGIGNVGKFREFANGGWADGAKRMREAIGEVEAPIAEDIRRRPRWGEDGDEIDMQRVWTGELDRAWFGCKPANGCAPKYVRLLVHVGALSSVSAEQMFYRGAACSILADALEEAGYRVEIVAYSRSNSVEAGSGGRGRRRRRSASRPDAKYAMTVPVKQSDESLDLERLAVVTAHAAMFRVAVWAHRLSLPTTISSGMGSTYYGRPEFARDSDVWIDNVWNAREARELVLSIVEKIENGTLEYSEEG